MVCLLLFFNNPLSLRHQTEANPFRQKTFKGLNHGGGGKCLSGWEIDFPFRKMVLFFLIEKKKLLVNSCVKMYKESLVTGDHYSWGEVSWSGFTMVGIPCASYAAIAATACWWFSANPPDMENEGAVEVVIDDDFMSGSLSLE